MLRMNGKKNGPLFYKIIFPVILIYYYCSFRVIIIFETILKITNWNEKKEENKFK